MSTCLKSNKDFNLNTPVQYYWIFKFEVDLGTETPSVGFDILWEFESVWAHFPENTFWQILLYNTLFLYIPENLWYIIGYSTDLGKDVTIFTLLLLNGRSSNTYMHVKPEHIVDCCCKDLLCVMFLV